MKAKIYYFLFLASFILHPFHSKALDVRSDASFKTSFQKINQEQSNVSADPQSLIAFFDDDIDLDDDDDVSVSSRKKMSFEDNSYSVVSSYSLAQFGNLLHNQLCYAYLYQLPSFYFISLNVLRL